MDQVGLLPIREIITCLIIYWNNIYEDEVITKEILVMKICFIGKYQQLQKIHQLFIVAKYVITFL